MKRARDPFDQINAQHLIAKAVVSRRARRRRKCWCWSIKQAKPSHWQRRHRLTAIVCSQRDPPTRRLWLKQRAVEEVKRADNKRISVKRRYRKFLCKVAESFVGNTCWNCSSGRQRAVRGDARFRRCTPLNDETCTPG